MTILGLREHIFTVAVSSIANYMALQETSFVTLGQRVLANPLCIRLHYGHPDVPGGHLDSAVSFLSFFIQVLFQ